MHYFPKAYIFNCAVAFSSIKLGPSPGSVLVLRELHHVSRQVTELEVWKTVVPEVFQ